MKAGIVGLPNVENLPFLIVSQTLKRRVPIFLFVPLNRILEWLMYQIQD